MEKKAKTKKATASKPNGSSKPAVSNSQDLELPMLEKFTLDSLKDIYWAEKHLLKALPKLNKAATSPELKKVFQDHLKVTNEQVSRLEKVFEMMGKKAQGKKCDAMEGLVKEAESIIEDTEAGTKTRDVALIMAAQKVEHYEIATYGGLVTIAKTMGKNDIADILGQTLTEEKQADQMLTDVAESNINAQATSEQGQKEPAE